jgi:putative peptidoglycan lipid II flippase
MTKAAYLGTTSLADAFGIGFMLPNLFRRLFAENSISVAFIPTFRAYLDEADTPEGKQRAEEFASAMYTCVLFLTALVVLGGIFAAPYVAPLFLSPTQAEARQETVFLTRIMFPYLFVISLAAFFQGILNTLKIFSPSGFTPVLFNILVIGCTVFLTPALENPARAMAVGVLAGGTAQALFQLPYVLRATKDTINVRNLRFANLAAAFENEGVKRVFMLIGPTVAGMAAYQLNDLVSTALAGRTGVGIVSSLQYSLRLQELILGIFAVSIGTVLLPDFAGLAHRGEWDAFTEMLQKAIRVIALITIPVTFFSLLMGENIIVLVYKSREFTAQSVALTREVFSWHIAGLFFIAVNRIIAPAFYACGDTRSPTLAGIAGFGVNILLALILSRFMKGGGIALALSIAALANTAALLYYLFRSKTIGVPAVIQSLWASAVTYTALSAIAAAPVFLIKGRLFALFAGHNRLVSQGIPLALGALIFAALGVFLLAVTRDPLLRDLRSALKKSNTE